MLESAHREHHEGLHDPVELLQRAITKRCRDPTHRDLPSVFSKSALVAARLYLRRKMILEYLRWLLDSHKRQMSSNIVVGVLALQGAFYEHLKLLQKASSDVAIDQDRNWEFVEIRTAQTLERCDALIIPGGESTTVSLVAARSNLLDPLRHFVKRVFPQ